MEECFSQLFRLSLSRHYSSLMHVSLEARIVIMRCLVVDPSKRVSIEVKS